MGENDLSYIDSIEFINLQPSDISPEMSLTDIKVLYLGENRNHTYINKDTAIRMAATLRGCPIVGYYSESSEDFTDHGQELVINHEGVKLNKKTKPYGFVAPNAKVWFQKFNEDGEERTYLMTQGYVWNGRYPELNDVLAFGRPHSMELNEDSMEGNWTVNRNGIKLFILNDAIFEGLCILGEKTTPCFEGSTISPSVNFTFDDEFKSDLVEMMNQMFYTLSEGGKKQMDENKNTEQIVQEAVQSVEEEIQENLDNVEQETQAENQDNIDAQTENSENADAAVEPQAEEEVKPEEPQEETPEVTQEEAPAEPEAAPEVATEEAPAQFTDLEAKYNDLMSKYEELASKFTALEETNKSLTEYKNNIEDKEKDAMIAKFYMLSDEDKKDVIDNKANYSLDDIEAKLSVIAVRNNVVFTKQEEEEEEEQPLTTFNLHSATPELEIPAWAQAVLNN